MPAWYNEIDPFAAAWLRELILDDRIAPGIVDERSIEDVTADDLKDYSQCHFFAGIGVWSLALREAGWPDDRPVWTGSCPCQPFSAAGKGGGFDDERHLWPAFHWLIEQSNPPIVLGEQVASKDGLAWLDLVSADLEASGYAFGAVDTCAAGFGSPHIRQRLYWMADAENCGQPRWRRARWSNGSQVIHDCRESWLAYANGGNAGTERQQRGGKQRQQPQDCGTRRLGDADSESERWGFGEEGHSTRSDEGEVEGCLGQRLRLLDGGASEDVRPSPLNGLWRDADWLCCTDGKWRPVAPGTFPLAAAGTVRNRVGLLRGAGNAINLAQAQGFIEAVIDIKLLEEVMS